MGLVVEMYQLVTMCLCGVAVAKSFTGQPTEALVCLGFAVVVMLCDVADALRRK